MRMLPYIWILCCLVNALPGQSAKLLQNERIKFALDTAAFRADQGTLNFEMYYSFPKNAFNLTEIDSNKVAQFEIDVKLLQKDSLIAHRNWTSESVAGNHDGNELFLTISKFKLAPGQYRCITRIKDLNGTREGIREKVLNLQGFPPDSLRLSDIQLAATLIEKSDSSPFTKNGYQVIPNPSSVFASKNVMIFFYTEIYNLRDSTYTIEYTILDDDRQVFHTFPAQARDTKAPPTVEVGGFNSISFPTGTYFLRLKIVEASGQNSATRTKKFFVLRQQPAQTIAAFGTAQNLNPLDYKNFASKSVEELDMEFYSSAYLGTKQDKKVYTALNADGKRRFLIKFWSTVPATRDEHLQKVAYANQNFSGVRGGWKTDRGRVIIRYGEPDKLEKNPNLGGKRAYEIWNYYTREGGLIFIFVDKKGHGDLELVHSSAPTEINNPEWKRWIE